MTVTQIAFSKKIFYLRNKLKKGNLRSVVPLKIEKSHAQLVQACFSLRSLRSLRLNSSFQNLDTFFAKSYPISHEPHMKCLSIIFALLACVFILVNAWLGPLFKEYDGCECGLTRTWFAFDDSKGLRDAKMFQRIENPGDPNHQHVFYDAKLEKQYPVFAYAAVGFGFLSFAAWFYRCKPSIPDLRYDHPPGTRA